MCSVCGVVCRQSLAEAYTNLRSLQDAPSFHFGAYGGMLVPRWRKAVTWDDGQGWAGPQILADMTGATAVHYSGHGIPGWFADDNDVPVYAVGNIGTPAIEGYRTLQMGTGNPPFNSTHAPSIHFAYLNTCCCGSNNDFIRFCIPYMNGYGKWLENQAVMAFKVGLPSNQSYVRTKTVFDYLASGNTVAHAREWMLSHPLHVYEGGDYVQMQSWHVPIYGDPYARLKRVYSQVPVPAGAWFRAL